MKRWVTVCCLAAAAAAPLAHAQNAVVYRCPGPPVLYTDAISAKEAQERGCRTIEGAPITVMQSPKPRAAASGSAPGASRASEAKVDAQAQRQRDSDARKILEAELQKEEARLAELKKDFNNGEPERQGSERNYARYEERVAEMKKAIERKEADIAAIKRELLKLTGP